MVDLWPRGGGVVHKGCTSGTLLPLVTAARGLEGGGGAMHV